MKNTVKSRYRHKLNMLKPGVYLCKIIGLLCSAALILYLLGFDQLALTAICISLIIFLILLILIVIEQHQDHTLYLDAKKEDPEIK